MFDIVYQVPDKIRTAPERMDPSTKLHSLIKEEVPPPLGECEMHDMDTIQKEVKSIYDYKVFVSGMFMLLIIPYMKGSRSFSEHKVQHQR